MTNEKYRDWLREIRKSKKLTVKATAQAIGIGISTYSQIESGFRNPSVDMAKRVADFFACDWKKFFPEGETEALKAAESRQLKYRDWLRDLRKAKGMTTGEVANALGVSLSTYAKIEYRTSNPSVNTAKKIGDLFGFDWVKFFEENRSE